MEKTKSRAENSKRCQNKLIILLSGTYHHDIPPFKSRIYFDKWNILDDQKIITLPMCQTRL